MKKRTFEIRGETRLKNGILVRTREELGMNQKEFAKHLGLGHGIYNGYETMRIYPGSKNRKLLASFCDCTEEELFPQELERYANGEEPRKLLQYAIIEPSRLFGSVRREALLLPAPESPEEDVEDSFTSEHIEKALSFLKKREAGIIQLYFGLDGVRPHTFEEIAEVLGITRERVRQIKEKALSKLRHKDFIQKVGGIFVEEFERWEVESAKEERARRLRYGYW